MEGEDQEGHGKTISEMLEILSWHPLLVVNFGLQRGADIRAHRCRFIEEPNQGYGVNLPDGSNLHSYCCQLQADLERAFGTDYDQQLAYLLARAESAPRALNDREDTGAIDYLYYKNDHLWVYVPQKGHKMVMCQLERGRFIVVRYFTNQQEYKNFLAEWEGAYAQTEEGKQHYSGFVMEKPHKKH